MKRLIVTVLATMMLGSAAIASDMPYRNNNSYARNAATFSWEGFYAGLNAGYAWNENKNNKISDNYGSLNYGPGKNSDGFTGGFQLGYNFQSSNLVFGLEADLNIANLKRRDSGFGNYVGRAETYSVTSETSWFGTVRPRLGFALSDRFLVFGTAGLAYGNVKLKGFYGSGGHVLSESNDDVRWGWTLGAGMEYAISDRFTLKGEYAVVDLSEKNVSWVGRASFNTLRVKDSPNFQLIRAGVNYKF